MAREWIPGELPGGLWMNLPVFSCKNAGFTGELIWAWKEYGELFSMENQRSQKHV